MKEKIRHYSSIGNTYLHNNNIWVAAISKINKCNLYTQNSRLHQTVTYCNILLPLNLASLDNLSNAISLYWFWSCGSYSSCAILSSTGIFWGGSEHSSPIGPLLTQSTSVSVLYSPRRTPTLWWNLSKNENV